MQDYTITGEQLQAFRQRLVWEEKSPATIEKYLRDAADFTAWLDGRAASKAAAGAWKAALLEAKLAPATINVKLAAVNRFLVFLGWPAFRVKPLRIQRRLFREPDRELDRSDYLRLIRTARQQGKKTPCPADGNNLRHRHPGQRSTLHHSGGSTGRKGRNCPEG